MYIVFLQPTLKPSVVINKTRKRNIDAIKNERTEQVKRKLHADSNKVATTAEDSSRNTETSAHTNQSLNTAVALGGNGDAPEYNTMLHTADGNLNAQPVTNEEQTAVTVLNTPELFTSTSDSKQLNTQQPRTTAAEFKFALSVHEYEHRVIDSEIVSVASTWSNAPIIGLNNNRENICYLNSVLQVLRNTALLTHYITNNHDLNTCKRAQSASLTHHACSGVLRAGGGRCVLCAYAQFINSVQEASAAGHTTTYPANMVSTIKGTYNNVP
jgi:hypothetical protein